MTVTVWEQGRSLLGGLALGAAIGLLYDLLRCIRYRMRGRIRCALLDLLFWTAGTAALFLWSVASGQGVVQISVCAAMLLGAWAYLRALSRFCFPVLSGCIGLLVRLWRLMLSPFRLLVRAMGRTKNFFSLFCKKHFSFPAE